MLEEWGQKFKELVDIGTEWNLKLSATEYDIIEKAVDIGTEWNLKG